MSNILKMFGGFFVLIFLIIIVIVLIIGIIIYKFIMGNFVNFVDNDLMKELIEGNVFGIVYKGGFIVLMLMVINIIIIVFFIECFVIFVKVKGKGSINIFVICVKLFFEVKDIVIVEEECDC